MEQKRKYGITFEATEGDYEDRGWDEDPTPIEPGDLRRLSRRGFLPRKSTGSRWFENDHYTSDYSTGETRQEHLHFYNVTKASLKRIDRLFNRQKIFTPWKHDYKD